MQILGVNAYHGDASACLLQEGKLRFAIEEERLRRVKHWAGFPHLSVQACGECFEQDQVAVAVSRRPTAYLHRRLARAVCRRIRGRNLQDRIRNFRKIQGIRRELNDSISFGRVRPSIYWVEHHRAHMASSFFASPFEEAALMSVDALGDFVSTMWGVGKGNRIWVLSAVTFPHSLGFLYTAGTQHLGFTRYGDEFKVMGLAALGEPQYLQQFRDVVRIVGGEFQLNLEYFRHHREGIEMSWNGCEPVVGRLYSEKWVEVFGEERRPGEEIQERHRNIAASMQKVFEEVYFHLLRELHRRTRMKKLCLAGGVALNSTASGKITRETPFEKVFIQPAAGDAGTALGAALYVHHEVFGNPREFIMEHAFWGPEFVTHRIQQVLQDHPISGNGLGVRMERVEEPGVLCRFVARDLMDGKVVGWFQGKTEWGPRALGNRSILADPRRPEMKDILNARIKRRESFRPFAPSLLEEKASEYFSEPVNCPFMLFTRSVRPEKREELSAAIHVDGTARVQTVNKETNPLFHRLIQEFHNLTGVPALVNTSFNENEPIVCNPQEALDCFLRTRMDVLVMDKYVLRKSDGGKGKPSGSGNGR